MNNEIEESAKAVQEIAKTTSKGIEATEKLGGFLAKYVNEPFETLTGMLSDKLHFMRWERQLRFTDRAKEKIKERNLENNFRIVPPKLALPIIENASLEENDELQDLWANLLVSTLDPNFDRTLRTAFIDILKQLEIVDVHVLNLVYSQCVESSENNSEFVFFKSAVSREYIIEKLKIDEKTYESSVDNLMRVRCIASYVEQKHIENPRRGLWNYNYFYVSLDHQYNALCITTLGRDFVEACVNT